MRSELGLIEIGLDFLASVGRRGSADRWRERPSSRKRIGIGPEVKSFVEDLGGRPLLEHAIRRCALCSSSIRSSSCSVLRRTVVRAHVRFGRAGSLVRGLVEGIGDAEVRRAGLAWPTGARTWRFADRDLQRRRTRFVSARTGSASCLRWRPGHPAVYGPAHVGCPAHARRRQGARALLDGSAIECSDCAGTDVERPEISSWSSRVGTR